MARNVYDQASRYTAKLDPLAFIIWLLNTPGVIFHRWVDTRRLPFPKEPDRICDTVALLEDPNCPGVLWLVVIEFQFEPRAELFGRLLIYLGMLWEEERPAADPTDHYQVGAVVVNLKGLGHTSRDMEWNKAGLRTCLNAPDRDLASKDAAATLAAITSGQTGRCVLPFIPLMQGGSDSAIIQQWLQVAQSEPDPGRRGDYGGLALVFAEAVGCHAEWKQALRGWNMVQSQQVLEWMAEGKVEGKVEDAVQKLLRVLELRFGGVPQDVETAIRAVTNLVQLDRWFDTAVMANSLIDFRQSAQL